MIRRLLWLAIALLSSAFTAWSQTTPDAEQGIKPYGSFHGGDIDKVSLTNGKLVLELPITEYSQRGGKLSQKFFVQWMDPLIFNQEICSPHVPCTFNTILLPQGGMAFKSSLGLSAAIVSIYSSTGVVVGTEAQITMADGAIHQMGFTGGTSYESIDATGFHYDSSSGTVTDNKGSRWFGNTTEDANGNYLTGGTTPLDTLGRTELVSVTSTMDYSKCTGSQPITSASNYTFIGPTGNAVFEFCYATIHYALTTGRFGYPTHNGTVNYVQSIVLPNLTTWMFAYDPVFAAPSQITLPTGGTISYTWQANYQQCQWTKMTGDPGTSGTTYGYTLDVMTRTVNANDGSGDQKWTYGFGNTNTTSPLTVTDPTHNDTVHTITGLGGTSSYYETETQTDNGTGAGRSLLKTVNTDFSWAANINDHNTTSCQTAMNVVPIRETTTWPTTGKVSKVETDYDTGFAFTGDGAGNPPGTGIYGLPIAKREYDFGSGAPGALIRKTATAYYYQTNPLYLTYNILTLPYTVQVVDGSSTQKALTTYGYDETAPAPAYISTQWGLKSDQR